MTIRYFPETPSIEQAENCRKSPLYNLGDCRLVWVNEGDLIRDGELLFPEGEFVELTSLSEKLASLPPARREKVERRVAELTEALKPTDGLWRRQLAATQAEIGRLRKILLAATNPHSASCAINLQWRYGVYPPCDCGVTLPVSLEPRVGSLREVIGNDNLDKPLGPER